MALEGGCYCGALRYEATGEFIKSDLIPAEFIRLLGLEPEQVEMETQVAPSPDRRI